MRSPLSLAHSPTIQFKSRVARPFSMGGALPTQAPVSSVQGQFDSCCLLCGAREVLIHHGSEVYRLRHTRNDKLILTK